MGIAIVVSAYANIKKQFDALISTPTRCRLASGAIWGSFAAVGSRGIALISSFFLARILGQVGFGEYGMVNSTAGMIGGMSGLGLGLTVTKHLAQFKKSDPNKAGRILALSSMVTMLSAVVSGSSFALLAPWLAEKTIAAPYLAPMLQISAITVAMGIVNGVQTSSLDGCEAFQAKSYVSLVTGALQAVMVVFGAWAWGLKGSVAGLAASMMMTVAVTRWAVTKEWERFKIQPRWHEAKKEWRILLHFSLPTFLSLLTIGPAYWGGNALLANRPNGYAELGIFSAAIQWQGAIAFLPGLVCTAMIPIMSERIGAGDLQASLRLMWRMMGLIAIAVLPITILLWLASPMIMKGYGTNFTKGYWSLILLIATGTVGAIMTPIANFVASMGMMWKALAFNTGWIAMMFLGSLFMVRWGAEGLAGARFIAQVIQIVMYLLFVVRIQNNMRRNYLRSKQ